ncbi:uncharacterized protein PITG_21888 [Phytophthora infestans T30-4]|uniref:Fibronectin type-III domain-containing protein n=1 Tax=Phytophthora infestans (strain T30-4) TaxID=403677 RepID=D0RLR2_PHYIT|nr:uncharacterized protein PITG_21888 [Phytophthora infestans T30-4]EEY67045.1 hypothetical protein PITG_21888 [Phytophthora infestans T30-4]|eukprot:XP_002909996.1 hypothetical protein PITG_21888 [Phytophthora infestans T30-4]
MGKADDVVEDESVDLAWRVELLRALITGDLLNVKRVIRRHVEAISAPFTTTMPAWTLQWEGMHWWMLRDSTPLFAASAYSRPEIVHWLLLNGADRSTPCYLKQTAIQIVGECCAHAAAPDRTRDSKAIAVDNTRCIRLLVEPPTLPKPPTIEVSFSSSYSSEVVITSTSNRSSIQQTVYKCLLRASWQTPLSNGAIIDKYELRYRRLQVAHNRKFRQQSALLERLQFNTVYEVMLRSWNAAGKGEWSPSYQTKTPAVPTRSAGTR